MIINLLYSVNIYNINIKIFKLRKITLISKKINLFKN